MKIFGYDSNDKEFTKIMELSQATLCCKKSDLNKIIDFLTEVKKELENTDVENGDHWHYRDHNDSWSENESDLIIAIDENLND